MGGSVLEMKDSGPTYEQLGIDGQIEDSNLWWAKAWATAGALFGSLCLVVFVGTRFGLLWKGRTGKDKSVRISTHVPEIGISPPPGEAPESAEEEEVASTLSAPVVMKEDLPTASTSTPVAEKSLPPLPGPVQLELPRVQEPIRVDVEGPEANLPSEPSLAVVSFPPIAAVPETVEDVSVEETKEDDEWELTNPPSEPKSESGSPTQGCEDVLTEETTYKLEPPINVRRVEDVLAENLLQEEDALREHEHVDIVQPALEAEDIPDDPNYEPEYTPTPTHQCQNPNLSLNPHLHPNPLGNHHSSSLSPLNNLPRLLQKLSPKPIQPLK